MICRVDAGSAYRDVDRANLTDASATHVNVPPPPISISSKKLNPLPSVHPTYSMVVLLRHVLFL